MRSARERSVAMVPAMFRSFFHLHSPSRMRFSDSFAAITSISVCCLVRGLPPHHFPNRRATKGSWLLPLTRQSHCMQTLSNCCPTYVLSAGPNTMCRAVNLPWPFSTFTILGLTKRYQNSGLFGIGANCDFGKPANSI